MRRFLVCLLICCLVFVVEQKPCAEEESVLVFSEDFSNANIGESIATIKGWVVNSNNGSTFIIEEDKDKNYEKCLKITHTKVQYGFDGVTYQLAGIGKGFLEFDIKLGSGYKGLSLVMNSLNNVWTAFSNDGWAYYTGTWTTISRIEPDKWARCKVVFDNTLDEPLVEFYVDGKMAIDMVGDKKRETSFGILSSISFQDYGLTDKVAVNYIDNIKVFRLAKK